VPTVRGPRRVTIYQSCLRLSAVIRNGTHYMSISVAVPLRQLRRIAKSAAVPSPSRVADAGVRRVRSIGRPDRYVRPGWVALPATTRLEEFAHRARRSSFRVGAAQTDRLLPAQQRRTSIFSIAFRRAFYRACQCDRTREPRSLLSAYITHPICTPDHPIPHQLLGRPFFSEAFSFLCRRSG
jgi:hypothetical protein